MAIKTIVAYDTNRAIGANNDLLWRIKLDMAHFKEKTMGNICAMGRKTWESIPEKYRPLEGRLNIVITTNSDYQVPDGVILAGSLLEAIDKAAATDFKDKDFFVCGGASLYPEGVKLSSEILATEIKTAVNTEGMSDVKYFPELDPNIWEIAQNVPIVGDPYSLNFVTYRKK